jgi:hypothetical protein
MLPVINNINYNDYQEGTTYPTAFATGSVEKSDINV